MTSLLERREGRLVSSIEATASTTALLGALTAASASSRVATAASTPRATLAPELATSATSATATAATSTTTALTGLGGLVVLALQSESLLLVLSLLGLLGLAAGSSDEVLGLAREGLALWELLLGALICLADGQVLGQCGALLSLLGEVLGVGLGVVFWLSNGVFADSLTWGTWSVGESWVGTGGVGSEARVVGGLGTGDGLAGLLVREFGSTSLGAPAVSCLLLVLLDAGVAVTVIARCATTAATASSTSTTATSFTTTLTTITTRFPIAVAVVALLAVVGSGLIASSTSTSSSVRPQWIGEWVGGDIALANARCGLVDDLDRRIRGPIRVELRVIACR